MCGNIYQQYLLMHSEMLSQSLESLKILYAKLLTLSREILKKRYCDIKKKISELNAKIANIPQVSDIGKQVNRKLLEMIGAI